jgi:hypothetical protein
MTLEPLLRKGTHKKTHCEDRPLTAEQRGAVECPYAEGIVCEAADTRILDGP